MPENHEETVAEFRLSTVKARVISRPAQYGDIYHVTVSKLYKDGPRWRHSSHFDRDDLPLLAKVADRAHDWIFARQQQEEQREEEEVS